MACVHSADCPPFCPPLRLLPQKSAGGAGGEKKERGSRWASGDALSSPRDVTRRRPAFFCLIPDSCGVSSFLSGTLPSFSFSLASPAPSTLPLHDGVEDGEGEHRPHV